MLKISKYFLFVFIAASLLFTNQSCQKSDNKPADKTDAQKTQSTTTAPAGKQMYDSKSGVIIYTSTAMGMEQKMEFYWDDGGKKEARYTSMNMKMMGESIDVMNVEINKEGYVYRFDAIKKQGTKSKSIASISGAQGMPDISTMSKKMIDEYKYKEIGTKDILGKPCKGYTMSIMGQNMESWMWNGVVLYMKSIDKNGKIFLEMKATKIDLNTGIPADKFNVPADIKLTETK